ncbi:MAG: hypothetical protein EU541_03300, partial [Promethearchaeota archaeon]
MEFLSMIRMKMKLGEDIQYSVLINTINFNKDIISQDQLFNYLKTLQKQYPKSIIQLFSTRYLINRNHLFYAIYYSLKAYLQQTLISHRPSMELLLYLSTNRQISEAIKTFGITSGEFNKGIINYCIVTKESKIIKINTQFLEGFEYSERPTAYSINSRE